MDKHSLRKIKLISKSSLELDARYLPAYGSDTAIMYCPGFGGGYGNVGEVLSDIAFNNRYGFLFGQFQDSYDKRETVRYLDDGEVEKVEIGATNSRLYKSIADFDCFFDFLIKEGYNNIIAVGVCVSASKLTYYLQHNKKANNVVSELILLAPQDFVEIRSCSAHEGMLEEAVKNIKQGCPEKILSKKFFGYLNISSGTYLDVCRNGMFNTLSYKTDMEKLKDLALIKARILFVMGRLDRSIRDEKEQNILNYFNSLTKNCKDGKFCIIDEAKHLFKGKEGELSAVIQNFVKQKAKEANNVQ